MRSTSRAAVCGTFSPTYWRLSLGLAALAVWGASCTSNLDEGGEGGAQGASQSASSGVAPFAAQRCQSELSLFATEVWAPLFAVDCLGCHVLHGLAPQAGSPFVLWDSSQPGYLAHNIAQLRAEAAKEVSGQSVLLAKPLGALDHGGGKRISASDPRYQAMASFANQTVFDGACDLTLSPALVASQSVQLSDLQVLRKAALQLAARLPTAQENSLAQAGRLDQALASVMTAPGFGDWVMRIFDDVFFNIGSNVNNVGIDMYSYDDKIARNSGTAADGSFWPNGYQLYWYATHAPSGVSGIDDHGTVMYGLSTLGLQLARHLATTGGDWRDILNANYLMLNPWTARSFSTDFSYDLLAATPWTNVNDPNEFRPINVARPQWPTAGLLTDGAFLNAFSTTITNRNRKRANTVHKLYLGLDVLGLGTQPPNLNALLASAANNPNLPPPFMSNNECISCHAIIDPIAGNFASYNDNVNFIQPDGGFGPYTMFPPGIAGTPQPAGAAQNPAAWLAAQITSDPRFVISQVRWWHTALTGLDPLGDVAVNSTNVAADLAAKAFQEQIFTAAGVAFVESGYNVQALLGALITSPYYRTVDAAANVSADDLAMISSLVSFRWVGADALNNRLLATLGTTWTTQNAQWNHWGFSNQPLIRQYESTLGSIDPSNNVTQANLSPTALMVRVATTMASTVACQSVAADFSLPAGQRRIFPDVEVSQTPATTAGTNAVESAISRLYAQVTGLGGADLAAESAAAFQIFSLAFQDASRRQDTTLPASCQSATLTSDPTFALKAWMATVAYVLADPALVLD